MIIDKRLYDQPSEFIEELIFKIMKEESYNVDIRYKLRKPLPDYLV